MEQGRDGRFEVLSCPNGHRLRVPVDQGAIRVTCPRCGGGFDFDPSSDIVPIRSAAGGGDRPEVVEALEPPAARVRGGDGAGGKTSLDILRWGLFLAAGSVASVLMIDYHKGNPLNPQASWLDWSWRIGWLWLVPGFVGCGVGNLCADAWGLEPAVSRAPEAGWFHQLHEAMWAGLLLYFPGEVLWCLWNGKPLL